MREEYIQFIKSDRAKEIFGFQKTRIFKSMDITFIITMMGKNEEYHMLFSMCPRWNKPVIQFHECKFSDKERMPYGRKWNQRELHNHVEFIKVGEEFFTLDDYAQFSCVNYLIHEIDNDSIFILVVAGSTPIIKRLKDSPLTIKEIDKIPDYAFNLTEC